MIRCSVAGATGYAGAELVRILLNHPEVELAGLSSVSYEGKPISEIYPNLRGRCSSLLCGGEDLAERSDVVFACLPAGHAEELCRKCYDRGVLFIDLGADFRLYDVDDYRAWYGGEYNDLELHYNAGYFIPEITKELGRGVKIIGNPGCYPTCAALALAPLMKSGLADPEGIIIDAKSGVTGAGRGLTLTSHFPECNEAITPYKIACHRHTPEIEQTLSRLAKTKVTITFVPHLLPVNRGILETIYVGLNDPEELPNVRALYEEYYQDAYFVRVLPEGETASIKNVKCSNYCDISLHPDPRAKRLIVVGAIDNLVKGAAGQAVQNMNVALGLPETLGLTMIPPAV